MPNTYHPKGSMCAVCTSKELNCARVLDFKRMPVMSQYSQAGSDMTFKVVKCSMFMRIEIK